MKHMKKIITSLFAISLMACAPEEVNPDPSSETGTETGTEETDTEGECRDFGEFCVDGAECCEGYICDEGGFCLPPFNPIEILVNDLICTSIGDCWANMAPGIWMRTVSECEIASWIGAGFSIVTDKKVGCAANSVVGFFNQDVVCVSPQNGLVDWCFLEVFDKFYIPITPVCEIPVNAVPGNFWGDWPMSSYKEDGIPSLNGTSWDKGGCDGNLCWVEKGDFAFRVNPTNRDGSEIYTDPSNICG